MRHWQIVNTITIALLVTGVTVLYFLYFNIFKNIGQLILTAAPIIIFFIVGGLVFTRGVERISKTKDTAEFNLTLELNWFQALKHDLLTYLVPLVILILPFLNGTEPDGIDFLQAAVAFFALIYLKYLYWKKL